MTTVFPLPTSNHMNMSAEDSYLNYSPCNKMQTPHGSMFIDRVQPDELVSNGLNIENKFSVPPVSPDHKHDDAIEHPNGHELAADDMTPAIPYQDLRKSPTHLKEPVCKKRKTSKEKGEIVNKNDVRWQEMFEDLVKYKNTYGDCIVPRGFCSNVRLASWVAEQRKQYKLMQNGCPTHITEERVDLLNGLGFAWNAPEAAWNRHFNDLKKYKEEHGNCLVPMNYEKCPQLGHWVKEQRRHYSLIQRGKESHMTQERIHLLESIGFCWDSLEVTWWNRYQDLKDYKCKHGNCLVPTTRKSDSPQLGTWVHHQRRQYKMFKQGKQTHMNTRRIAALDAIGFVWSPRDCKKK